ncbi:hypothetical protein CP985_07875 [Malaciobacter mytili LMG 24559]|uniref:Type I secretion system outer membrane protein, TolC family n=1 Tax=Malaciobacter mytili LMG 24559 TaxID=1032238 RepID=A0AAX2AEX5_9BACT|nr:TolC family protein [Malaciobacter mytili]AXH15246.1 type I secretion system outer membrane protein, TolC family [Malaciobacter mytili LMG 24559]RXK15562.1 hypothetical protein CP985_07875 [Malaciobacter mytili LMG 24559]
MKKNLIPYLTISLVFTFSLNAQEIDNTVDNLKENSIKLLNEKSINKVYSDLEVKGMIRTTTKKLDVSNYVSASEISFDKYQKVSLKDVVLETLSYSDLVKSSREKVIQSQLKLDDAIADYFPTLNLEYSYAKTRHYPGDNKQRYKFYNDRSYRLVMSQNLYSGGATHTFIESLRQSLLVERNKYKIAVQEELTKAIKAYFGVVFSKKAVEVNDRNMKQLQKILDIVTIKYDNGASSIGDLTSIKASVANAQTKLIKDKSKLNEALRYYEYVVGQKFSKTLPFERDFDIKLAQFDILYERAVKQNPNLKNYYFNIEAEKHKVRNAKTSFSPRVDLELSYEDVMDQEDYEGPENDFVGKIKLSYNIFNGGKDRNKVLKSYSVLRDLKFRLNEETKKLKWNLSKLHTSINSVNQALKTTKSEVVSSKEAVDAYWEAFKLGEQDLNVLLQGQRQLNSAELELLKFQNSNIEDYFLVLSFTGDLLSFFDIDPESDKFIDFSNSSYNTNLYNDSEEKTILDEVKQESVKVEKVVEVKPSIDENINNFISMFLQTKQEYYILNISSFDNVYKAFDFIKEQKIDKESFAYDKVEKYEIKTNVAYKIFENELDATTEMQKLKDLGIKQNIEIKKVKEVKELYAKYLEGLKIEVEPPKTKVKIIEKIQVIKPINEFKTNEEFKEKFLNAPSDKFTINVATFPSLKIAGEFVEKEGIYNNSFVFKYVEGKELVKVMYGVFDTYEQASQALDLLDEIKKTYFPIIEKIDSKQKLYKQNSQNLNEDNKNKVEYELVTKTKTIIEKTKDEKTSKEALKQEVIKENNKQESLKKSSLEPLQEQISQNKSSLKQEFLEASRDAYSINLATLPSLQKAIEFVKDYNIEKDTFVFTFGKENFAKVMYKVLNTYQEGLEAINTLPKALKNNSPYVEKIYRKQDLYYKYHKQEKLKEQEVLKTEEKAPFEKENLINNIKEEPLVQKTTFKDFKEQFYNDFEGKYTILIGSVSKDLLQEYLTKLSLRDNLYVTLENKDKVEIYYGVFDTQEEALNSSKNFSGIDETSIKLLGEVR